MKTIPWDPAWQQSPSYRASDGTMGDCPVCLMRFYGMHLEYPVDDGFNSKARVAPRPFVVFEHGSTNQCKAKVGDTLIVRT